MVDDLQSNLASTSDRPAGPPAPVHRQPHSGDRLRALTDGVFAIAITLLVLELPVPHEAHGLGTALLNTAPKLAVYLLVAAVLGGMWFRNRTESEFVARVDHVYSWLTFAWLAIVTLVPWSASVTLSHPSESVAVATFTANALLAALVQQLSWLYATGRRRLVEALPQRTVRASRFVGFVPAIDFAIALVVGLFSPHAGLILNLLAPLAYVTGLLYRLLARLSGAPAGG